MAEQPLVSDGHPGDPGGAPADLMAAFPAGFMTSGMVMFFVGQIVVFYYVDVGLDLYSISTMWDEHRTLALLNTGSIILASIMGCIFMLRRVRAGIESSQSALWIAGCLYFTQLHILVFGVQSFFDDKTHPLLLEAKFVEATVESVLSANLQLYAVMWAMKAWDAKAKILVSVCWSFFMLALAYAEFDLKDKGIAGVRGSIKSRMSGKFLKVLAMRMCEVVTRVTSVAAFQGLFPYGSIGLICIDLVLMLWLTREYGGSLSYAVPSVFAFMNPMLENHNAATVPCGVYFAVRFVELAAMGLMAVFFRQEELHKWAEEEQWAMMCLVGGLMGMLTLIPYVRESGKDTLLTYEPEFWHEKPFTSAEVKLLHNLSRPSHSAWRSKVQAAGSCCTGDVAPGDESIESRLLTAPGDEEGGATQRTATAEKLLKPLMDRLKGFTFQAGAFAIESQRKKPAAGAAAGGAEPKKEDYMLEVEELARLAWNCPVWEASLEDKTKLVRVFRYLADPRAMVKHLESQAFPREVLNCGGLEVALRLAQAHTDCEELVQHTLKLVTLIQECCPGEFKQGELVKSEEHQRPEDLKQRVEALQKKLKESVEHKLVQKLKTADNFADLQEPLLSLRDKAATEVEALVEAGCSTAVQDCCMKHGSPSGDGLQILTRCVIILTVQHSNLSKIVGRQGPQVGKLARTYTRDFIKYLQRFLAGEKDKDVLSQGAVHIIAFVNVIALYPPAHVSLLPLLQVLTNFAEKGNFHSVLTLSNMAFTAHSRPFLRSEPRVKDVLMQVIQKKLRLKDPQIDQRGEDYDRYIALRGVCMLLGECDELAALVLENDMDCLTLLLKYLDTSQAGITVPYLAVMPFPALASVKTIREFLHKCGADRSLADFCVQVGLDTADNMEAVGFACNALAIIMGDPDAPTNKNQGDEPRPWKAKLGENFQNLWEAAKKSPKLQPAAETLDFFLCSDAE